jgi:polysaccharide pyruvyl transferase WcaK-like protein
MYKNIIEYLHCKYPTCTFNLFSTEYSDYGTISELYEYILKNTTQITKKNLHIQYIESLDNLLNFYQNQDLLIGTRMHSLIIAYTQSLPIMAISWQSKVSSFMEYINLNQYCFHLNEINEKIDEIYYKANELLTNNLQTSEDPSTMYKINIPKEIFE